MSELPESAIRREQLDALQSLHDLGTKLSLIEDAILRALDGLEGIPDEDNASVDYTAKQVFRAQDKLEEAMAHHNALVLDFRRFVGRMDRTGVTVAPRRA
jgi:hypothetical protein